MVLGSKAIATLPDDNTACSRQYVMTERVIKTKIDRVPVRDVNLVFLDLGAGRVGQPLDEREGERVPGKRRHLLQHLREGLHHVVVALHLRV